MIKRKALFFIENYDAGGSVSHMYQYAQSFLDCGFEVCLCTNRLTQKTLNESQASATINICLNYNNIFFLSTAYLDRLLFRKPNSRSIFRKIVVRLLMLSSPLLYAFNSILFLLIIIKENPWIVAVFNGGYPASQPSVTFANVASLLGKKHFMSVVSMPSFKQESFICNPWNHIIDLLVNHSEVKIVTNANSISESLVKQRKLIRNKLNTIYAGIDDIHWQHDRQFPLKTIKIGVISRQDPLKGGIDLIQAFEFSAKLHPNIELIVGGDGSNYFNLVRTREASYFKDKIHLLGNVSEEKKQVLEAIDIYVFPSHWEGLPASILEAMSASCAIISTNVGGIPEVIRDYENGILVPPRSPEKLSAAINTFIENKELRIKCSRNARQDYLDRFTSQSMMTRMTHFIKSL